ncbi:MAG: EF-P lysine aminoacylase GenX [Deltaproteobacteria bacterium]|nr:EF-P lysine aminoacylase GenX [Deltaproteobacteria bacterium]
MNLEGMHRRAAIIKAVRAFFDGRGFLEVDTPVAVTAPAPEPQIEAPATALRVGHEVQRRFLQTSPELMMKRLLAAGVTRAYQIAPVFRDRDFTSCHRPEFRLLEWYRRDAGWQELLTDCEGLLAAAATAAGLGVRIPYQGKSIDLQPPFRRLSVEAAFVQHAGFSILEAQSVEGLQARLTATGVRFAADDTWDDLFHRVFLTRVEPEIVADPKPVFLTHYPAPLAALARLDPDDPRASERFELYAGGLELANGFGELTDPGLQRRRFADDRARRRRLQLADYPFDERFLAALATLPPSAGIALGVDRLLMLLFDAADIDRVAFIPWSES